MSLIFFEGVEDKFLAINISFINLREIGINKVRIHQLALPQTVKINPSIFCNNLNDICEEEQNRLFVDLIDFVFG